MSPAPLRLALLWLAVACVPRLTPPAGPEEPDAAVTEDAAAPDPAAPDAGSPDARAELRLMSFNIRFNTTKDLDNAWPLRRELVYRVIREADPDLLGVQEALRDQLDDLRAAFPELAELGVGRDDGQSGGEHASILYRTARLERLESGTFWLSETPDVPSRSWGEWPRICTWARFRDRVTGRTFALYNTHLDLIALARERGIEVLAARLAARSPRDPLILMGDFNAGENNGIIRYLTGQLERPGPPPRPIDAGGEQDAGGPPPSPRLLDTFRVVHPGVTEVRTNHGWLGTTVGDKIDYVFIERDREVAVLGAEIVRTMAEGRYPSDHFPVTAVIRF